MNIINIFLWIVEKEICVVGKLIENVYFCNMKWNRMFNLNLKLNLYEIFKMWFWMFF